MRRTVQPGAGTRRALRARGTAPGRWADKRALAAQAPPCILSRSARQPRTACRIEEVREMSSANDRNQRPTSLARIGKVDPQQLARPEPGWVSLVRGLNILGPIAEAYGKTLAYRVETK